MSRLFRILAVLLTALASSWVLADPPARVGRLSVAENDVRFSADRDDQGSPASINWPISTGAMLDTGQRGRAEVWVGSTAFRLAPGSQLEFSVVDDREVSVRLVEGSLAVSIFDRDQTNDVTVQTPEGLVRFSSSGRYRVDVLADHSELTAQAGRANFSDSEHSVPVGAGQKARMYGEGRVRVASDNDQDAFDYWVSERENAALATTSRRYVSPAMTGYQDLDAYGDWNSLPEYGAVWYPRSVADDWAPYRFGRWVWVAPWGWTWVDQSPWGFAPFHYGRWVRAGGRWGWVPGSYAARPVYAPALVAWVGNPGWNVTFRAGAAPAVGWFPLAPREVYVPGFRATPDYVHRVNGSHVRDMADVDRAIQSGPRQPYAYRALPQAVTVVPAGHLREGRAINAAEIGRQDRHVLEQAPQARPAPDNILHPPANGQRSFPGEAPAIRQDSGGRPFQRGEAVVRPLMEQPQSRPRESVTSQAPLGDGDRRRGFNREPNGMPAVQREALPVRQPEISAPVIREVPAVQPAMRENRRQEAMPPMQQASPAQQIPLPAVRDEASFRREPLNERQAPVVRESAVAQPAIREIRRDERESRRQEVFQPPPQTAPIQQNPLPAVRDEASFRHVPQLERQGPAAQPVVRDVQRQEMPRQEREAPRPREMPQAVQAQPQPQPQQPQPQMRAPLPQAMPSQPVQQRGGNERRRERDDERGQR